MNILLTQKVLKNKLNVDIEHLIIDDNKAIAITIDGVEIELSSELISEIKLEEEKNAKMVEDAKVKADSDRAALLNRLGITEAEARLLLS